MEIGAARTLSEAEKIAKYRSRLAGSASNASSGGGNGPDSDGGDLPDFPVRDQTEPAAIDKSKYIVWFLMLAGGMTFAGLLGAYLMIATNKAAEWRPFDLPV